MSGVLCLWQGQNTHSAGAYISLVFSVCVPCPIYDVLFFFAQMASERDSKNSHSSSSAGADGIPPELDPFSNFSFTNYATLSQVRLSRGSSVIY